MNTTNIFNPAPRRCNFGLEGSHTVPCIELYLAQNVTSCFQVRNHSGEHLKYANGQVNKYANLESRRPTTSTPPPLSKSSSPPPTPQNKLYPSNFRCFQASLLVSSPTLITILSSHLAPTFQCSQPLASMTTLNIGIPCHPRTLI